jgi:hypothetical protein
MQHRDFSVHPLAKRYGIPDVLMIGWLDKQADFRTGDVPSRFLKKLNLLLDSPVTMPGPGFTCPLCSRHSLRSTSEYWLRESSGRIYVAPALLHHYINTHSYVPPPSFVTAVISLGGMFRKSVLLNQRAVAGLLRIGKQTARIG